ncbi:MAG: hypothetical protein CM1200mP25_2270 [Acidobacteriota bacterium]|nr:MAG: hypothetical protein CM1200mP25_2270 [Acidobacteriota bacterium]
MDVSQPDVIAASDGIPFSAGVHIREEQVRFLGYWVTMYVTVGVVVE